MERMKRANRHVSVILEKDVEGTGFAGELLTVKPGFARNFLLPNQLAAVATPQLKAERDKHIAAAAKKREDEVAARHELADQLAAEQITVKLKTGPDGQVFGSISARDVAAAVKTQRKLEVDAKHLTGVPIKRLGSQSVSAKLGLGVTAQIHVQVEGERTKTDDSDSED
jgi:large subunit ribosomal protein L9